MEGSRIIFLSPDFYSTHSTHSLLQFSLTSFWDPAWNRKRHSRIFASLRVEPFALYDFLFPMAESASTRSHLHREILFCWGAEWWRWKFLRQWSCEQRFRTSPHFQQPEQCIPLASVQRTLKVAYMRKKQIRKKRVTKTVSFSMEFGQTIAKDANISLMK